MTAPGRPNKVNAGTLYVFAHQFYWDFRRIDEGTVRWWFDRKKFQQLTDGLDDGSLIDNEDRARYRQRVDEEIRTGGLDPFQREQRLRDIEDAEKFGRHDWYSRAAAEEARREIKIPGEPDVIKVLLNPNSTPEQVREVCKDAVMTRIFEVESGVREAEVAAWPISFGSMFPTYLSQYAEEYVAALRDPRFPRCDISMRPSSRLKQLWFLSRALAGALFGVKTRTAINLVGSMRPEQMFYESRSGKPARKQRKSRHKL